MLPWTKAPKRALLNPNRIQFRRGYCQPRLETRLYPSLPQNTEPTGKPLAHLLTSNAEWAKGVRSVDPGFFQKCAEGQNPRLLWLGCADSRVPESKILDVEPGEIFVHRNIASQFSPTDDAVLSVLQYGIHFLEVKHVVVVGHTQCGGALNSYLASFSEPKDPETSLDRWLSPLNSLARKMKLRELTAEQAVPLLVEENVRAQVANITKAGPVLQAWKEGKEVHVHGWVYEIETGLLRDLEISVGPDSAKGDTVQSAPL